ncbi:MAG: hypothetical protein UR29_C0008G0028 [Candidatus Woesebacteria bacterium GW2011_GWC2_33_12]|uniref:Uncharacterized protein n=1 Tax=Candidatus Woesebacteria bacterium GW2011_GWB1_33_22 TaxID=1618566 RepID=A0A0F9ZIG0_9BACT|nr:MAG: hypothetical protein UR29_C0008G0028 [Candidatus Woesebacteria bacterium GW2011_GWC2_33_12]KKP41530.1 MAG: hypothetical protein UR33_C0013G0008 [Candidatus Woesebacteria bacterium GW2011_GWA2_33_20]KKP43983.1 MAG: hypothetical protein UR35_C0013G0008 [Candidatus Woesebacteria bacterium GW2011_GWB1_33_22]KKP46576.1 MAG: hypothetical protein UR37_C0006G0026 [Microgenomates group bacterium GW2011_GWC1_33_28]KKP49461.1 MAG: hypothetical protein UR41_C0014G0008 [Candidatus Woesebacteria bact
MCNMTTTDRQRTTLFFNPQIIKHAKAQAVIEETTLTALIEKALIKYLPEQTIIKKAVIK